MGIELWHPCTLRKSEKQCIFPRSFCDKLANQGWLTKQRVLQDFHAPPSTCPALCALAMGQVKVATRNKIPRGPLQATYECTRSKLSRPHCLWHAANCHTNLNHWKLALTMKHGSSTIWESTYNVENMGNISYSTFWTSDSCTVILPYIYIHAYISNFDGDRMSVISQNSLATLRFLWNPHLAVVFESNIYVIQGLVNVLIEPKYWGYNFQQILFHVQNRQNGTFTKPCHLLERSSWLHNQQFSHLWWWTPILLATKIDSSVLVVNASSFF